MRTQATIRNALWGILQQAVLCVLGLLSRRVMLQTIGVSGVGLNGLLTNVLSLLSLTEMGVGSVIIYHMYAPLANGDWEKICRLMQFYRNVYRRIALAMTGAGLLLVPFLPYLVRGVHYSHSYVTAVFLLFLAQTASSYLFSYKRSLLSADQKQYVITIVDLVFRIVSVIGGIAVLLLTRELLCYLFFLLITGILNNLALSRRVDRLYPELLRSRAQLPRERRKKIFRNVRDLFIGKLSWTITSSTDNLLISALVGTIQVGLYSNYTIVLNTLTNVVNQLSAAMSGSIGNLLATGSKAHVDAVLRRLLFLMYGIASFCCTCLLCLLDPFIALVFGKEMVLDFPVVCVCILNFFLATMRIPIWNMLSASGLFKRDKYISIAGSTVNLVVSFVLGKEIGMLGILIGTTCTYAIQFVLKILLFYRHFLHRPCKKLFLQLGLYLALTLALTGCAYGLCGWIATGTAIADFVLKGLLAAGFSLGSNLLLFCRTDSFRALRQVFYDSRNRYKSNKSRATGEKGGMA